MGTAQNTGGRAVVARAAGFPSEAARWSAVLRSLSFARAAVGEKDRGLSVLLTRAAERAEDRWQMERDKGGLGGLGEQSLLGDLDASIARPS